MAAESNRLYLYFPHLHPVFASKELPKAVKFFDPAVAAPDSDVFYRPETFPMSSDDARKYLAEMVSFAERFQNSGELTSFLRSGQDAFYGNENYALRREVADVDKLEDGDYIPDSENEAKKQKAEKEKLVKSQLFLILVWTLEEKALEFAGLESDLSRLRGRFEEVLGLEKSDDDLVSPNSEPASFDAADNAFRPDPTVVLQHMLRFIPENAVFVTEDGELIADLEEKGVPFRAVEEGDADLLGPEWIQGRAWNVFSGPAHVATDGPKDDPVYQRDITVVIPRD